jgi:hypothetical protein
MSSRHQIGLVGENAAIVPDDRPGPCERIDRGVFVVWKVGVGSVEIDLLLKDRPTVLIKGNAGGILGAWVFETARLGHEHIIAAVAILIDPSADRVAGKHRIGIRVLGPVARHVALGGACSTYLNPPNPVEAWFARIRIGQHLDDPPFIVETESPATS